MTDKHILDHLHKYMFLQNVYLDRASKKHKDDFFSKENVKKELISNIFVPGEKDKLFWCFFIMQNGMEKYLSICQNHFQIETSTKISIAESLKKNEILLKQNKLKRDIIENELVNENKITMDGMKALCVLHRMDLLVICKNMFYKISGLSNNEMLVIEKDKNDNFGVIENISKERIQNILTNYYEIVDYKKKIKSVSSYKLDELKAIANKFKITLVDNIGNKKTKNKLYEEINTQF